MKKNTILALVISFFFVLACIVGYFLYKGVNGFYVLP